MDSGSRLRVRGEGNAGRRGGEPGDLYVYISIKDHPELRRDGTTIHSDVEVSYVDAILGTQVRRPRGSQRQGANSLTWCKVQVWWRGGGVCTFRCLCGTARLHACSCSVVLLAPLSVAQ